MKPLSVYVHIPFCTVKCGYCDFNAYAGMDGLKPAYRDALLAEIESWRPEVGGREVVTIAFGGGTPGEVPADHVAAVIGAIRAIMRVAPQAEIGLEANPGTTGLAQLHDLRAAGVNRISFGVQSFDPAELRFLDRIHSPEAAEACVALAREARFESVNVDLIYGLPGQSPAAWERSLGRAIALRPDGVSAYGLAVEDGTLLAKRVRSGAITPMDGDSMAEMYECATDVLEAAGFRQYELSNWARPGHESRHNQVYWRDGDYLGIGAGAHGYLDGERYENVAHPRAYVARLSGEAPASRPAVAHAYRPSRATAMFDWLTLALRLSEGLDPAAFAARFDVGLDEAAGEPLREAETAGLVERDGGRVRLTRAGRLLHGEIAVRILAHLRDGEAARPEEAGAAR